MKITFLGATEEVTGSKYLVEHKGTRILVDCGLFQGKRELRERNWESFPVDPGSIDAIVVTHAHIDHTGYIPALVKHGFRGKIYCSKATYALSRILLKDSAFLQEEDAKKANKYGYSRHKPALPLYTVEDAERALTFFQTVDYDTQFEIGRLKITLICSGHILGASFIIVSDGKKKITFSGDLGRPNQPIMKTPPSIKETNFLVLESTYGDLEHAHEDSLGKLEELVGAIVKDKSLLIIPAFAVGRTQMLLHAFYQLQQQNRIPKMPIYLDSPMAIKVTDLFCQFKDEHKLSSDSCEDVFDIARYVKTVEESKQLNNIKGPAIIIAGSGMADGGRVVHHLIHTLSNEKNIILFVGYQASGTNGRELVNGADHIKIHGHTYSVHARIETINSFSAHADYHETLQWLSYFKEAPQKVFITHGELEAAQSLQIKIEDKFGWSVVIPKYLQEFDLD